MFSLMKLVVRLSVTLGTLTVVAIVLVIIGIPHTLRVYYTTGIKPCVEEIFKKYKEGS